MSFNWKELQNGSDIRGISIEGVAGESINLTADRVEQLGKAFYLWLKRKNNSQMAVAIGMDSRVSGPELIKSFSKGITSLGGDVIDCGLASTPAIFMTTKSSAINVQAGVMLTASHLPYNRNGLKFFTTEGGLNKNDISEILELAAKNDFSFAEESGQVIKYDFINEYSDILINKIRSGVDHPDHYITPLQGLNIIVDAGNGAGGFFAEKILVPLGADIEGSQFLDPDGMFPNHIPNPENKQAMESICAAVLKNNADLGIIFDTDVDRAAVVDKAGKPINRNALIALISSIILEEHPGSTIVTDSITSDGLGSFIEYDLRGVHHRYKRGYKNVIDEAIRLNESGRESWIAIETSGHAALKENYFLDDGAYLVAKILIKMARMHLDKKTISSLIEELHHPLESEEFRLTITHSDFSNYGVEVINELSNSISAVDGWQAEKNNYEGIRVKCQNANEQGWFLLRMSLHDPVMPLNIESDVPGGVNTISSKLHTLLSAKQSLNTSVISG